MPICINSTLLTQKCAAYDLRIKQKLRYGGSVVILHSALKGGSLHLVDGLPKKGQLCGCPYSASTLFIQVGQCAKKMHLAFSEFI